MKVSIILPALNEEEAVASTIKEIPLKELKDAGYEVEVIVVDNNSEDGTAKEAKMAGAKVVTEPRRGYGNACIRGFNEATGDIMILADADGTYPLTQIPLFIEKIIKEKADFVNGSRFKGKLLPGSMPFLHKYFGNPILTGILNILFRTKISDAHCGMKALTRQAWEKMNFRSPGMEFASEIIIEAKKANLRIQEVPVTYRPRRGGQAKLNSFRDGWRHLRFMLLYESTLIFLIPGILFFTSGSILLLVLTDRFHSMLLGSFLTILGFQVIVMAAYSKAYAVTHRVVEAGKLINFFARHNFLEYGILLGLLTLSVGVLIGLGIIFDWVSSGYGELSELRNAIISITLSILGVQMIFSSLFIGVLLLNKGSNGEGVTRK